MKHMKKWIIVLMLTFTFTFSSCTSTNTPNASAPAKAVQTWWGTKAEIKTFLDSPNAQANRWFISALGE